MGNIVLLDDLTINKIAAGEVVERPASVIKEMVENSIDAGATNINIEIRNGGISYIRITDNGKGIQKDDMEMAFERHATSKIRSANDLSFVKSMGFRGEALASIAAIANVEMISKTAEASVGNKIIVEAGNVLLKEETGCPIGTTITVQNLFFNTPVRYKFLKKDYTESGYIEDVITRLALVNPDIAFKLINSGKTIIQTLGGGNLQDVIYAIYGKDIASSVVDIDYSYEDIHITGVVGKPEIARSNRGNQIFFVNKRYVKDKTLSGATENSFKGLLPIGKYGFVILNIDMKPSKVDVNVHPAKLEVRFEEENKVFKAVYHAIKDTLLKTELIANTEKTDTITHYEDSVQIQNTKPSITDLFRKIKKEDNKEKEEIQNNVISDIYYHKEHNQHKELKDASMPNSKINSEPKVEHLSNEDKKMDVFKELISMQKRLKQEAENNPNLHTDIETLISKTKKIGITDEENLTIENISQQNNIQPLEEINKEEKVQEIKIDEVQNNNKILLEELNIDKTQETKQAVQELKTGSISQILPIEEQEEYTIEQRDNTIKVEEEKQNYELKLDQSIKQEEAEEKENQIIEPLPKENDTKVFSQQEIQEMMDKLEKIENIDNNPEFDNMYEKIFGKLPPSTIEEQEEQKEKISAYELIKEDNKVSIFEDLPEYKKPTYKLVGIAFNTYIIIEIQKELYIIDQHAAHERVMYEKVKENYYSEVTKDSQMLLLPDIITLTHKERDILIDNSDMFEKAGFVFEEFGENTIKLIGVPNICLDLDTKELFLETLDEINTVARTAKQEIEEKFIATVACKAAVKAHMNLTQEEVDSLMEELLALPNPFTCPHGRPTAIRMEQNDIEKKFARRK
ncbi:MAG: DNA mismatch repair endonuclease MutL [Clostridia bacterium]|nr:DNA mismatch repair endonuclease MutL [Clostridia bacterium]